MDIIQPGIRYRLFHFSKKDNFTEINFVQKVHKEILVNVPGFDKPIMDGIVDLIDGVTNEEVFYMLLDRFKYLNDKHYSKQNEKIINYIREIIGELKSRKKTKQENKKRYEEIFKINDE